MASILSDASGGTTRNAAVAGRFYTNDPQSLRKEIVGYMHVKPQLSEHPKLLISPHAGYVFSGPVAGRGYAEISDNVKRVIIIGPSHYEYVKGFVLTQASWYETPLGKVAVDTATVKELQTNSLASISKNAEEPEHSLEVQIPFLQVRLKDFSIVPVITGNVDPARLAELIFPFIDDSTLVVASSDLSHYHTQTEARELDNKTVETILDSDSEGFLDACGETPIRVVMSLAKMLRLKPVKLDVRTSYETAPAYGEQNRVVGYASIAFVKSSESAEIIQNNSKDKIDEKNRQLLLKIARGSLEASVRGQHYKEPENIPADLKENRGCFVTLTVGEALRGCIGYIEPIMPLYNAVVDNAKNAALSDPRFSPVTAVELDKITVEVSVLTVPQRLKIGGPDDILLKLRPEIDGVILEKNGRQSTFLPQVWEQLPDKIDFLRHLSLKAGLGPDDWKSASYKIYQAEHFSEKNHSK